ncbi:MAG: hypothetical protein VX278_12040 [Myxococcota bacterium]|nr:hypothetical protein [Myxococcota bacterium]
MLDFIQRVELDAPTAICIAAGMKQMAASDNEVHQREVAFINEFIEEAAGSTTEVQASDVNLSLLHSSELKSIFLKSLAVVALADGKIRTEEKDLLNSYAKRLDYDGSADQILEDVARAFLGRFRSISIFRGAAEKIGRQLGLSEEAIKDVLDT